MTDEDSKSQVGVILLKTYSQTLRWVQFIREGHVILSDHNYCYLIDTGHYEISIYIITVVFI